MKSFSRKLIKYLPQLPRPSAWYNSYIERCTRASEQIVWLLLTTFDAINEFASLSSWPVSCMQSATAVCIRNEHSLTLANFGMRYGEILVAINSVYRLQIIEDTTVENHYCWTFCVRIAHSHCILSCILQNNANNWFKNIYFF